jgi:DNA-binding LytR/AlgR family response regulator
MKNLNCLIVDDEPLAIDVLENYLRRLNNVEIVRCENALDALRNLREKQFDIMFLDIQMPLLTGLELLKSIASPPAVIITTAYRDYAVEGFEFQVTDYLLKPISFVRFMKAFERALKTSAVPTTKDVPTGEEHIFLKVDKTLVKVLLDDILYVESVKDYVRLVTNTTELSSYRSLTSITASLPEARFMRVHRSFTIAIDKVTRIKGNSIEIKEKTIPLSREQKSAAISRIINETSGLE